jgi:hypothetical protein
VESSCELGNELSGSIKCWETTEWLHNLWPLERYSAPQSYLVSLLVMMKVREDTRSVLGGALCYWPEVPRFDTR